jgi:hypothetical protein
MLNKRELKKDIEISGYNFHIYIEIMVLYINRASKGELVCFNFILHKHAYTHT